tara:strand:- start:348 stop:1127 length:780 start_codon:yes stop_codon:yes gene_type:complete
MKISIITVVRNNKETIKDAIESVLFQEYENIEYIIIDGNSTDGTVEIIKKYGNKIDNFVSEKDNGLYDAMNKGINMATGDIVGFLNSDDLYVDRYVLSKVASEFNANHSLDACYADLVYVDHGSTSKAIRYWKSSKFTLGLFSKGWSPPHPTFFVNRRVYKKFGNFNIQYHIASDIELMIRFLEVHKIDVSYIPQILVKMRYGGISNKNIKNMINLNQEILDALERHNLPKNIFVFFFYKLISRAKQFLNRHNSHITIK